MKNIRKCVRLILINPDQKILFMCADDPTTTNLAGEYHGRFWFTIGGQIEPNETLITAAKRELFEETGLSESEVRLGPIVWFDRVELILADQHTQLHQQYMVAHCQKNDITACNLTNLEKEIIVDYKWFDLAALNAWHEPIFPASLSQYLPAILSGHYPVSPIDIT